MSTASTSASAHAATVQTRAYATDSATSELKAAIIERRALRSDDISIKIHFCGVCHTDLHMSHNDWGNSIFPMVPGHEIVGVVDAIGGDVTKFKIGDRVGVGAFVSSCRTCDRCKADRDAYCEHMVMTYSSKDIVGGHGSTHGGYSERIVVQEPFVVSIPDNLDFAAAAPLLCAGVTTYSPLADIKAGPGKKVGILGIGGLGHIAIKIARAMGAHVVAITGKESKRSELLELGAHDVVVVNAELDAATVAANLKPHRDSLDIIIDTVSASHPVLNLIDLLKFEGHYHLVGLPNVPTPFPAFPLVFKRIIVTGSLIGGIKETQDVLNLCAEHNITATIETLPLSKVNEAFHRLEKGDVRYRFVLDVLSEYEKSN